MHNHPWLHEYELCDLPATLEPYPETPVYRFLEDAAEKFPRAGLIQSGFMLTYQEVKNKAWRLAAALAKLGVEKGDRVATILPTSLQFVIADYAISRSGAVHIPSSFLEPPSVLEHKFREGAPKVLIYLAEDLARETELVNDIRGRAHIPHVIVTTLSEFTGGEAVKEEDFFSLRRLIEETAPEPPDHVVEVTEDLETLLFTGGTTGLPKGCMLTHRNITANALQSAANFKPINDALQSNFSVLLAIPFYHSYGHIMMHTMTHLGVTQLLVPDPRDTTEIIAAIRDNYPMFQFGVPTQYMKMLKEDLKDVKILGVSGSAALPTGVQEQFEKKSGGGIMEGYGLSECSPNTHLNPSLSIRLLGGRDRPEWSRKLLRFAAVNVGGFFFKKMDRKKLGRLFARLVLPILMKRASRPELVKDAMRGSIGIPFHDTLIKVVDESGATLSFQDLKAGKVGEMCISGPQRMRGYWPTPGSGLDEEGYVRTGDVVRMDERGYFYIVDRTKDMIIVSGFKVYSREIDDILYGHPAVEQAATIGVPDPAREGSETVKVVIQLQDEYKGKVTETEIIEFLRDKVAKYAVPKKVEFIDEMPLTSVQKVDKKALRKK